MTRLLTLLVCPCGARRRFDGDTGQLLTEENYEWGAYSNLDRFFSRLYSYYLEKGFSVILLSRVMNVLTLAFTIFFSGFLLLYVNWGAIHECGRDDDCDVANVVFNTRPLKHVLFWKVMVIVYLTIFSTYFAVTLMQIVNDMKELVDVKDFVNNKLGMSERELQVRPAQICCPSPPLTHSRCSLFSPEALKDQGNAHRSDEMTAKRSESLRPATDFRSLPHTLFPFG